ncbi:type ISP restriction/modification enzyme [Burkholderia sp.]|uniref:type ISP restriction/modification enzyme n=1 Tax=Burkholderia sp. TaxID=36773 RepID=UPI002587EBAD|nr:type ISP restriction/modification enzyme [Burkholderia sp.]MCA3805582.1 hypothetical protein [Burkholderia sp.]
MKFLAFAELTVSRSGSGVIGYINSNSWLDRPTFRGVRASLLDSFPRLSVVDLHGNIASRETDEHGTRDEGVFEIEEGTNITIGSTVLPGYVHHTHFLGAVDEKLRWLQSLKLYTGMRQLSATAPNFHLLPLSVAESNDYNDFLPLNVLIPVKSVGVITKRDALTIDISETELLRRVKAFSNADPATIHEDFDLPDDVRDWKISWAQSDLNAQPISTNLIRRIDYRPFDRRFIYYTGRARGFVGWPVLAGC